MSHNRTVERMNRNAILFSHCSTRTVNTYSSRWVPTTELKINHWLTNHEYLSSACSAHHQVNAHTSRPLDFHLFAHLYYISWNLFNLFHLFQRAFCEIRKYSYIIYLKQVMAEYLPQISEFVSPQKLFFLSVHTNLFYIKSFISKCF